MPFMYKLYAEFQKFDHFWAPKQLLIRDDGRILGSEHWAAGIAKPDGWGHLQYKHSTCMYFVYWQVRADGLPFSPEEDLHPDALST